MDCVRQVEIDYDGLFEHVAFLRKVLLVASGRTGSDFFQSLLDGHPEILQFTGIWFFHEWWKGAKCKGNLSDLIDEFIWYTCDGSNHIAKFKSYYCKIERWDRLGSNKNEYFEVDIPVFKNHMINILANRELSSKNMFLAINLAYGFTMDLEIKKTKILFYHIHHLKKLEAFREDFPDYDVIMTIRDPRNTLVSGVEHWKKYDPKTYTPNHFYSVLRRIFEESELLLRYTKNIRTLKLEDLHLFSRDVLEEFCGIYDLELEDCMFESSYHGKKWWGDEVSGKYLDGFNRTVNEKNWGDKLFCYDNFLIEFILEHRLRHYRYMVENIMSRYCWIPATFFVLLPMRYELRIFFHNFKTNQGLNGKMVSLKRGVQCYLLRIHLYFRFMWKKITKAVFLANFFYHKKYG